MQQNLLNAEFASGEYRNAGDKNMHVFGGMKALTNVSRQAPGSFCWTYACPIVVKLHCLVNGNFLCLKRRKNLSWVKDVFWIEYPLNGFHNIDLIL